MGDFGAEVIKIEHPKIGDPLRGFGTPTNAGDTSRLAQRSPQQELHHARPARARGARSCSATWSRNADVLIENFRPGTLEKWGLGWDVMREINPKLVMLRISAYGQTGPLRDKPGLRPHRARLQRAELSCRRARQAAGNAGLHLARRLHVRRLGLRRRDDGATPSRSGPDIGQVVDIGLYKSIFRMLDEIASVLCANGYVRERMGPDVPHRRAARALAGEGRPMGRSGLQQRQDVRAAGRGDGQAGARPFRPLRQDRAARSPTGRR